MEPKILEPIIAGMKEQGLGDPSPDEFSAFVHCTDSGKNPNGKMCKTYQVIIVEN